MTNEELTILLAAVRDHGGNPEKPLRSLARVIGASLPERDLSRLQDLAQSCRREARQNPDDQVSLALTAVSTVVTSFASEVANQRRCLDVGMLAERSSLLKVLEELSADVPRLPSELAQATKMSRSEITKRLAELRQIGLCEVRADAGGDGRSRPHVLTPNGVIALFEAKKTVPAHRARAVKAPTFYGGRLGAVGMVSISAMHISASRSSAGVLTGELRGFVDPTSSLV